MKMLNKFHQHTVTPNVDDFSVLEMAKILFICETHSHQVFFKIHHVISSFIKMRENVLLSVS